MNRNRTKTTADAQRWFDLEYEAYELARRITDKVARGEGRTDRRLVRLQSKAMARWERREQILYSC